MNARAIEGVTPAYNPLIPFVLNNFLKTSRDFNFSAAATASPFEIICGRNLVPCIVALIQSKGNETNQAQAPEIPPATGTVHADDA